MSVAPHAFNQSGQSNFLNMLVENYRAFSKSTCENILGMAETVRQAEDELSDKNCKEFFNRIGLDRESSTVRKLRKIAERSNRFHPVVDQIPNNWTTLYALAKLPEEHFADLVEHKVLHPFVTMKGITAALDRLHPTEKKPRKEPSRFTIDLSTVEDIEERHRIQLEIHQILVSHGVISFTDQEDASETELTATKTSNQQTTEAKKSSSGKSKKSYPKEDRIPI